MMQSDSQQADSHDHQGCPSGGGSLSEPIDFFDPAFQRDPFAGYRRLREEAPILWDEKLQCFIVSRYDPIRRIALDAEAFSNIGCMDVYFDSPVADQVAAIRATTYPTPPMIVTNDPPHHTLYRRISNKILTPRMMRESAAFIEGEVEHLLAALLEAGGGDVVSRFCVPLPVSVISTLMGFPRESWDKVKHWSDAYTDPLTGMIGPEREIECAHLYVERQGFFAAQIERRRADPSPPDDIVTGVALAELEDGGRVPMPEALAMLEQFMVAGNETTTNALSMGLLIMAQQPDLVREMREDIARVEVFTDEMLRLFAPAQGQIRTATRDVEIDGVAVPKGAKLMLRWAAANRDEAVFPRGEDIDLGRRNARNHLTFGFGIHTCQGAPLARVEMNAAFRHFVRTVDVSIDERFGAVEHVQGVVFMGMKSLPLSVVRRQA